MARNTTFRTWDDYFIPGTSVLRNKFTAPGKPTANPIAYGYYPGSEVMNQAAEAEYTQLAE
ncbi:hypothetical protein MHJ63_02395 [Pseudoglutamicibacter albus]|uniref:hypothetical protein n=1 Tax=Pseudoglutamicibacter albus TaxID=98671 RepID=UPI001EF69F4D|nr:hypothetical protein [Pseudoglutamicibacter albus]MCG7304138.1 hypothetical protein [Pseudoglutamicibacter albus]